VEAVYAHYCLQKLGILPGKFLTLNRRERAFVMASIDVRIEKEKKDADEIKSGRR